MAREKKKMKRILVAAVAAVALAACASPHYVTSDVIRFHTLPAAPSGQTFVIATQDADQSQSLAFRKYADEVSAKLTSMGLQPASGPTAKADFVVTLSYGVRGPTPDIQSRDYGPDWGFGVGYHHGPWGWGGYGGPGWDHYTDTRQLFVRRVEVDIYRGSTYDTKDKERVFEGRALSVGQSGQLEGVMPYILDALFKNFPGRSGEVQRVAIEVPPEVGDSGTAAPSPRSSY
jgi:hypothetical protein